MNLILLSQAVLAVGCIVVILGVSTAAEAPLWVFLAAGVLLLSAVTLVYRKIRRRARELKQALDGLSVSDRQCEISLMDGMVQIHVFRGPPALKTRPRRLLDVGSAEEGSTQLH